MRPRTKKNIVKRLETCAYLNILNPGEYKGKWHEYFGNQNPVHLEIGCGKGTFIAEMAKKYPDINFIAMELYESVIITAMERIHKEALTNVRFICGDARSVCEIFTNGEITKIYLNFSDPWSKKGYAKRRLTHPLFLDLYKQILSQNGSIEQKTDNRDLFDFSLESYEACGFKLSEISYDLHASNPADNIMTEYEQRFYEQGLPIHKVLASIG